MSKVSDYDHMIFGKALDDVPYVSRQDLMYERRKKERDMEIERARLNVQNQ